jgi:hypothetical protein
MSCWVGGITKLLARFGASCPTFQFETSWSTAIKHIRLLLILFIISQWVYQVLIQAHLKIIMALDDMLGWRDYHKLCWQDLALLAQLFSPKPPDQQPSSTSDCCSSLSSSSNGSTRW